MGGASPRNGNANYSSHNTPPSRGWPLSSREAAAGASARTNGSVGDRLRQHRQAGNRGDGRDRTQDRAGSHLGGKGRLCAARPRPPHPRGTPAKSADRGALSAAARGRSLEARFLEASRPRPGHLDPPAAGCRPLRLLTCTQPRTQPHSVSVTPAPLSSALYPLCSARPTPKHPTPWESQRAQTGGGVTSPPSLI